MEVFPIWYLFRIKMHRPLKTFSADPHKDKLRVGILCMQSFDIMFLESFIFCDTVNIISVNFTALKWYRFIKLTQPHIIRVLYTFLPFKFVLVTKKYFQFCRKLELGSICINKLCLVTAVQLLTENFDNNTNKCKQDRPSLSLQCPTVIYSFPSCYF